MTRFVQNAREQGKRSSILPGANTKGVITAEELLRRAERDSSFKLKGDTLVIGGTSAAMEAARAAVRCGSEQVVVVCLEKDGEWQAPAEEVAKTREAGVRIVHGWGPTRVESYKDGRVSGVHFRHCERAFDKEGNLKPIFDNNNVMAQYCDNLVLT